MCSLEQLGPTGTECDLVIANNDGKSNTNSHIDEKKLLLPLFAWILTYQPVGISCWHWQEATLSITLPRVQQKGRDLDGTKVSRAHQQTSDMSKCSWYV
jgi:hypothetical protein